MNRTTILLISGLFFSGSAFADEAFGPPLSRCLAKHIFPFIQSDRSADDIVNTAYKACGDEVKQWDDERVTLPNDLRASQDKEIYDFYLRMIDIRRKSKYAF